MEAFWVRIEGTSGWGGDRIALLRRWSMERGDDGCIPQIGSTAMNLPGQANLRLRYDMRARLTPRAGIHARATTAK